VTQRIFHLLKRWLPTVLLLCLPLMPLAAFAAEGVEIRDAHLENTEEGYKLSCALSFELNHELEEAVTRGIPLYFTTEIQITRPRWYWFDERAVSASQTIRLSYNVLTGQYYAAILGHLQQSFTTLDDALSMVRHPIRWVVAEPGALKRGETYHVAVKMRLDLDQLPKTFQVHALNNSDWHLSSDWKTFDFKAE